MTVVTYTYRPPAFATGGPMGPVNVIVIHDIECPLGLDPQGDGYARMLTGPNYLGDPNMTQIKSVHYVVGVNDICASTPEDTMAWHARGASAGAFGIEQEGYASFTEADWTSLQGTTMINNTAKLVADIAARHGIPIKWLSGQALHDAYADHSNLAAGGITTHHQLTIDGIGGNDHTDPGPNYPMGYMLTAARNGAPPIQLGILEWISANV